MKIKKNISIFAFIIFLTTSAFCQQFASKDHYLIDSLDLEEFSENDKEILDSALTIFHQSEIDSMKIKAIGIICQNMMNEKWEAYQDLQYSLIEKALLENNTTPNELRFLKVAKASALNNFGYICDTQGNTEKALEFYMQSIRLKEDIGDIAGLPFTLNNIGTIYESQGNISLALDYYYKSLTIQQKLGDLKGVASSFTNIGIIYDNQKDYKTSKEFHKQAIETYQKINDKHGMAISLNNLGFIYYTEGNVELGLSNYKKSLSLKEELGDKKGIASSLNNIGGIYLQLGNIKEALSCHLKSLEIAEQIGQKELLSNTQLGIADVMLHQNRLKDAEYYAKKSLFTAQELGFPLLINNAAKTLSLTYKEQNLFKESLFYYELHIAYRDSINNEANQKEAIRTQTKYEFEKAQIIEEQRLKEERQKISDETQRRDNLQYSIILIGILTLFGLVLFALPKVSPLWGDERGTYIAEGLIFFAFLIFFEFLLVLADPYVDDWTGGAPGWKLLINAGIAAGIFPLHAFFERKLKNRIVLR